MALMDFASRLLGYNPFDTQNSNAPVSGQQASTAAIAQPTLGQMYQDDLQQAQMGKLGNLGMLLLASSQQLTPAQRATILAQAPQYMDGAQRDAMTAAQARLMNMQGKAAQDTLARQEQLRANAPDLARQLGFDEKAAGYLTPEQLQEIYVKKATQDPRDAQLKDAQIQHYLNSGKTSPTPQMVDLPDGGKGWATPGSANVLPISGSGKGALDPTTVKRLEAEDKNLTYAKEAISANRVLSDPAYSGELTDGYKNRVNLIPTLEGSWAGEKYLTGDSQANSFVDSVIRPRSGAKVDAKEETDKKRLFTPMPGDSQERLYEKAQMRANHINSLIAGANPADRPMLQKMFQDSEQELLGMIPGAQNSQPQLPPGVSIRRVN